MAPRIHLIAPAGTCSDFIKAIGAHSPEQLVAIAQEAIGSVFTVTANEALLDIKEDELGGGRTDDEARAADITTALADDDVAALVAVRGGAWFTRILPRIDFSVLDRRTRPVAVWGFSELTTLVNIVGARANGRGVYAMGPAFLVYGLKRLAQQRVDQFQSVGRQPQESATTELRSAFVEFFRSVSAALRGAAEPITIEARVVRGDIDKCLGPASFVGGNLTVLSTMIGSRYDAGIAPERNWLMLEDFNDKPERFDRFFAHLTLAGYFDRCQGILLGDFHLRDRDLLEPVLALLDLHLSSGRRPPVLATREVGHVWPMTPLPLHVPADITCSHSGQCRITFPQDALVVMDRQ